MENTPVVDEVVVPKKNVLFEVTTLSKTVAVILFIILPFLGFWIGINYGKNVAPFVTNGIVTETIPAKVNDVPKNLVEGARSIQIKNIIVTSQNEESFADPYNVTYEVSGVEVGDEVISNLASFTNPDGKNGSLETAASTSVSFIHPLDKIGNYKLTVTSTDGVVLDTAVLCMKPDNTCTAAEDEVSEYVGPLFE